MSQPPAPSSPSNSTPNSPAGAGSSSQTPTTSGANPTPKASSPVPAGTLPPRLLKIKVDGKEMELPESEVLELASRGKASNQRFQEAAKMKREADAILKHIDDNPAEAFTKRGKDARKWAEEFLMNELKKEAESPEQKRARENEEKLRKYETTEKEQEQQRKDSEMRQAINEQRDKYDKLFTQALFESGLPRTPFTVKRMAELQKTNLKNKLDLSAPQLAKLVREDYVAEQKALLGSLDGDQLIEFLGPENAKKYSKAQISKLRARGTGGSGSGPARKPAQSNQGLTWRELQKRNRKPL